MKKELNTPVKILFVLIGLIVLNVIASSVFTRFDLTQDKRYTLSEASKNTISEVNAPIVITVFLKGDLPSNYKRLATETEQLLVEFSAYNSNVKYSFVDPIEENAEEFLNTNGMPPTYITEEATNKISRESVYPWAIANYGNKNVKVALYKNNLASSDDEKIAGSVQHLEYAFADAFTKLTIIEKQTIAILKGNGELDDVYIASFLQTLKEYYKIAPFDLSAFPDNPEKSLENLKRFDLAIVPKPTKAFSDEEKYILDQYTLNGGKSVWLIENVLAEMDSLYSGNGNSLAFPRDLRLNDFFFQYGVRINPKLVNDMQCAPIMMAVGEGNNTQFLPIQWRYNPLVKPSGKHPITNNTNLVRFEFANQIDTLKSSTKKTILLKSSAESKLEGVPKPISLSVIENEPKLEEYQGKGNQNLAVLLEGTFESVYKNRVKPFELSDPKNTGTSKMLVIADGDVIKNQVTRGRPQDLGFDIATKRQYGNKEFLLNSVNYLLDNNGLINIRSKELKLAFLNTEKVIAEKSYWQMINIGFPLVILAIFGFVFTYLRKRKFAK
ncbi:gliding motility-associated ABC transporter substrate-binding protein GldG [Kordia sp. YSTF-M3]|uniref:Gliding motility-associated ABC transporter substrate-binding protein GldG n=1 Tax=Kordia aestuariivivens TaxID=2759037 RepID=A0ABR7QD99_9FLAO|nr:gliding motility-associated ABC transporter substrate-binding protein GldG [Kordia aestuariivivens]MBC8756366.1 gliding motility-associated ABC transporter substrate-binding protein GldG [Kordia aestuariivivens]